MPNIAVAGKFCWESLRSPQPTQLYAMLLQNSGGSSNRMPTMLTAQIRVRR